MHRVGPWCTAEQWNLIFGTAAGKVTTHCQPPCRDSFPSKSILRPHSYNLHFGGHHCLPGHCHLLADLHAPDSSSVNPLTTHLPAWPSQDANQKWRCLHLNPSVALYHHLRPGLPNLPHYKKKTVGALIKNKNKADSSISYVGFLQKQTLQQNLSASYLFRRGSLEALTEERDSQQSTDT